jgi:mono/diheme cytochrome c family protein
MNKTHLFISIFTIISLIAGYFIFIEDNDYSSNEQKIEGRWYTKSQVTRGQKLFQNNCAVCHGDNAQGTFNWRKPLSDGSYPPPPLNGTAHTWHHPMAVLKRTIRKGGVSIGGKMPPFKDKLSTEEIEEVIAYFQSKWNSEIYEVWQNKINK